jgi:hypothetical protein
VTSMTPIMPPPAARLYREPAGWSLQ